jgi:hypothetical protein
LACLGCTPGFLDLDTVDVKQTDHVVTHPMWNPRSVAEIDGILYSAQIFTDMGSPRVSLVQVDASKVTELGSFQWDEASNADRIFVSFPVNPWSEGIYLFAHDDQRNALILRFSRSDPPKAFWRGSAGINADMIYDPAEYTLVVLDYQTIIRVNQTAVVSSMETVLPVSQPAVFSQDILVRADERPLLIRKNEFLSGSSFLPHNRLRQVAAAEETAALITTNWFSEDQCIEVLESGSTGSRCTYARLPQGAWRIRRSGSHPVLWEVDRHRIFVLGCDDQKELMWKSPVSGMVWVCPSESPGSVIVAYESGYSVLSLD